MNLGQNIIDLSEKYRTNKHFHQSATLMIWNVCCIPLGIISNIVITRYLGAKSFGDYLYVSRVFAFAFILLGFGVLQSLNRAILLSHDEKTTREYYGSGFLCLFAVYFIISIALYVFTFVSPNIREKDIFELMVCVIPFSLLQFTSDYFEQVLPSSNRITELIVQRYVPRILLFVIALVIYFVVMKVDMGWQPVVVIWTLHWGIQLVIYLWIFKRIKPDFTNIKARVKTIFKIDKEFGIQVYFGNLFSTAFTAMMPIFLSYFGDDNSGVGFYSLSLQLSQPLSFIPVVVATSYYQKFADYKAIPRKLLLTTFALSVGTMLCLWIIITPFINIFYTSEFSPVIYLTIISSIGTLLYGFSDFFSRYLMAQGKGKPLRNSSFVVGFTTLAMSVAMIPCIHETGAAITHVAAGLIYFFTIVYYYRRCVKENTMRDKVATWTNE